ncbi:M48 family metallopeptidase [Chloroflexota bacterium]
MMNPFLAIILSFLILDFVLDIISNVLNMKALKLKLPSYIGGIYKPDEYRNSQEYTRVYTRFELLHGSVNLAVILAFWFSGGFNYLDQLVRTWEVSPIISGLLYVGILVIGYSLITLPFSVYATFVIEERFGFNRTSPRTFLFDHLKSTGLSILIGGSLLAGVLALFEHTGASAWLYGWLAAAVFIVIAQFIAPTWIMPLFNKFTRLKEGELRDAILKYTHSVGYNISDIFVMDASRRTSKSNAFFTGFGRNKRIALFDTLVEKHTTPELVAVLAHEIAHYQKKHIQQGIVIGILNMGLIFFLLSLFINSPGLYQAFYMSQPSVYAGLVFFSLLYIPVEMLLSIVLNIISRRNEYQADRFAVETIEEPESIIDALKKLSTSNLSNLTPHPFYVFLNYSHPPLLDRIRAIERII